MSVILASLLTKYWPALLGGLAFVLMLFGVRRQGKADARIEIQNQLNEQASRSRMESRNVQDRVARKSDDAVSDSLKSEWLRDSGKSGR